jgi:uncharacterized phiE125 gp8 family phage protein
VLGALRVIQGPAEEPLSPDEMRDHLRVTDTVEEPLLVAYLTALRQLAEKQLDLAFLTQMLEWTVDEFPCYDDVNPYGALVLPRQPLQSVVSLKYIDTAGAQQTWSNTLYLVDALQSRIVPAYGQTWPQIRYQPSAIVVRYLAGYLNLAALPEDLRQMMRLAVGTLFEFREGIVTGANGETLPHSVGVVEQFFASYQNAFVV